MRRWTIAVLFSAAAVFLPAGAQGYLQGSAGLTTTPWLDISGLGYKLNTGYNLGVSAGLRLVNVLGPSWDIRADALYTNNQYACCTAHLGATSLMANLIYHFDVGLPFKPYVGVGVGGVDVHYGSAMTGPHDSGISFGGQALAGVEYPLFGRFSAFGEYRYITANNTTLAPVGRVGYQSHNFMAGLELAL
jgi:opacity protein-like surface antigen